MRTPEQLAEFRAKNTRIQRALELLEAVERLEAWKLENPKREWFFWSKDNNSVCKSEVETTVGEKVINRFYFESSEEMVCSIIQLAASLPAPTEGNE